MHWLMTMIATLLTGNTTVEFAGPDTGRTNGGVVFTGTGQGLGTQGLAGEGRTPGDQGGTRKGGIAGTGALGWTGVGLTGGETGGYTVTGGFGTKPGWTGYTTP